MQRQRIKAGLAFGIAGFVAAFSIVSFFFTFASLNVKYLLFYVLPATVAGTISGGILGAAIFDKEETRNVFRAASHGVLTAAFSYIFFWPLFLGPSAIFNNNDTALNNFLSICAAIFIGTFWTLPFSIVCGAIVGAILYYA